jgi:IclR family acetate operon transcriptional repressor
VREGRKALFIDHATTSQVISISGQTGELVPLYCTSHGKALLADFDATGLKVLFGVERLEAWTKQTIVSLATLADECKAICKRGYATDESEYLEGVRCLAAPIRDKEGMVIASIGISAPSSRFPAKLDAAYARQVTEIALQIGKLIGTEAD